ncbi:MAG TPA: DEAD/DEAH box helicase, partial [Methanomicrobiales archaeon]|nr:DEAD/DEAH box helicase [Methanomicrobiales archaeon]
METATFRNLALSHELERAIADLGFEEPTPIQALAIPVIRSGKDVIGQAHTGTGKTAAYGIPLLETIDPHRRGIQALVLCPTRELAIQVSEELTKLAKYRRGITILPVYGGQS